MELNRKTILLLMVFLFRLQLFSNESGIDTELMKGRDILPLPDTDERIDGYRKDYRKVKGSHIQFPSKYSQKKKEAEIKEEPVKVEKQVAAESDKPVIDKVEKQMPGYSGEMVNGLREGKGKLVLENGDIYEGNWKNGKKSGHGIYLFANGIKYNGSWNEDLMDGEGSLIFPDSRKYYGNITKGKITGYGTFVYSDGARYEGCWKDGKWHGEGKFKLKDGRELKAIFVEQQVARIILEDEKDDERNDID